MEEQIPTQTPTPPPVESVPKPAQKKQISGKMVAIILTAVVVGLGTLLAIIWLRTPKPPTVVPAVQVAVPTMAPAAALELTSPVNGMVVESKTLAISGKTAPDTAVVFYTDNNAGSAQSDAAGVFSGQIDLTQGINTLTVTAMGNDGQEKAVSMDVIMDNQVLGKTTDQPDSGSGRRAVVGQVEKLNTKDVAVKSKESKLLETLIWDEKTKVVGDSKKFKVGAQVALEVDDASRGGQLRRALKIFVKAATESGTLAGSKRQAVQGVVTGLAGNTITLAHQIQQDRQYSVIVNGSTVIKIKGVDRATLAQIQVGERIVAVGDNNGSGVITAKWIHVIPGRATGIWERLPISPHPTPSSTPSATPTETATPSATPAV